MEELPHSSLIQEFFIKGDLNNLAGYVCIPANNEEPFLKLISQLQPQLKEHGLLIFINAGENASKQIKETNLHCFLSLKEQLQNLQINCALYLSNCVPQKQAGVGYARKYIMDLACNFCHAGEQTWIAGLDADCSIDQNYILALDTFFQNNPSLSGASLKFEHPMDSSPLEEFIHYYESHLRYLKLGLQWAKHPFYFHTVGSSMAVRASAYKKVGGMNKRKAGEDFYFLQKIMPLGYGEIYETCVCPSPRISDRVPFGTGRAMGAMLTKNEWIKPYPIELFEKLKEFMYGVQASFNEPLGKPFIWAEQVDSHTKHYFTERNFEKAWDSISKNSSSAASRNKKFMHHLSGNAIILFLNHERERINHSKNLKYHIIELLKRYKYPYEKEKNLLTALRKLEEENPGVFIPKF